MLTLSLSATTPKTSNFEQYVSDDNIEKFMIKTPQAQLAVFWCVYCEKNLESRKEVDLKEHLASKHNRCGTCELQFPSLKDVRFHEADHTTSSYIKRQESSK